MSEDTKDITSRAYVGLSLAALAGAVAYTLHHVLILAGVLS